MTQYRFRQAGEGSVGPEERVPRRRERQNSECTYQVDQGDEVALEFTDPDAQGSHAGAPPYTTVTTRDAVGSVVAVTDPLGRTTAWQYDEMDRLTTETLPDPNGPGPLAAPESSYTYDANGNLATFTDPLGFTTW